MIRLRSTSPEPRLEMTPLLDVVFLLLTFFAFALVLMVRAEVLDVALPTLSGSQPARGGAAITVALDDAGTISVDGEPVERALLADAVRAARERVPDASLFLAIDIGSRSGDLIQVVQSLREGGITDFSIVGRAPATVGESPPASGPQNGPMPGPQPETQPALPPGP